MINNAPPVSKTAMASSISRADHFSVRQAFYARIRTNFIQQSARYLKSGLNRTAGTACPDRNTLVPS